MCSRRFDQNGLDNIAVVFADVVSTWVSARLFPTETFDSFFSLMRLLLLPWP